MLGLLSVPLGILLAVVGTRLIASGHPAGPGALLRSLGNRLALGRVHGRVRRGYGDRLRTVSGAADLAGKSARDVEGRHARQQRRRNRFFGARWSSRRSPLRSSRSLARCSSCAHSESRRVQRRIRSQAADDDAVLHAGCDLRRTGRQARRVEDIVSRVEALPAVRATFASNFVPLSGGARRRHRHR